MARFKQILRTTASAEENLRYIDEIVRTFPVGEIRWEWRELKVFFREKNTRPARELDCACVRFTGKMTSHYYVTVLIRRTRVWMRIDGGWQTHYVRLVHDENGKFVERSSRLVPHE